MKAIPIVLKDIDYLEPQDLLGLCVELEPKGDGLIMYMRLHDIYNTPSKNPKIISSELLKEDFPIYMNQEKDAYITVKYLWESMIDGRVNFYHKNNK